jgi:hypothetical protein
MLSLNLQLLERASSLRLRPVGITVYTVNEAIRGVVPPAEWDYGEHKEWFARFVERLNRRFRSALTEEQRRTIADLAGSPVERLYAFYLDPQVAFAAERYRPDPEQNAVLYLRRAYGMGAAVDICTAVKRRAFLDPTEAICYSVGGVLRYLQAIL